MRIAFIAAADNLHTLRWVNALADRGHELHLLSAHRYSPELDDRIVQHPLPMGPGIGYVANAPSVRKKLRQISPSVVNAHYASGYGTLARLSRVKPTVMSVWGSDVFDFPRLSAWRAGLIRRNLAAADIVCSISEAMARQCRRVGPADHDIRVVPWGVQTDRFVGKSRPLPVEGPITIGTVKTLAPKYGIDTLIDGFSSCLESVRASDPALAARLRLRLVGAGPQEKELRAQVGRLGLSDAVEFVGHRPHSEVVRELNGFDIYVAVSRLDSESFGVAVVEAMACRRPVIVSDAGGLPEVVRDGETGIVVPRESPSSLASALERLLLDDEFRSRLAEAGRRDVERRFEWSENVGQMESLYEDLASSACLSAAA